MNYMVRIWNQHIQTKQKFLWNFSYLADQGYSYNIHEESKQICDSMEGWYSPALFRLSRHNAGIHNVSSILLFNLNNL